MDRQDRHLLPDEIDQLLDGEAGFGTAPLKAHIRRCAECRAELESAQMLVRELEHLPLVTPSVQFSDRVMSQVAVFVPWHAAALDTARGWLPTTRVGRIAAGIALVPASLVLMVMSWLLLRNAGVASAAVNLAVNRVQATVLDAVTGALSGILSESMLSALRSGGLFGLTVLTLLLIAFAAGAARAVRAMAGARSR